MLRYRSECSVSTTLLTGSAYELELSPEMETKGLCDFGGTFGTKDYWIDNMTAHGKVGGLFRTSTPPMLDLLLVFLCGGY
jgi:hypothetical protein